MRGLVEHEWMHVHPTRAVDRAIPDEPALLQLEEELGERERVSSRGTDDPQRIRCEYGAQGILAPSRSKSPGSSAPRPQNTTPTSGGKTSCVHAASARDVESVSSNQSSWGSFP